MTESEDRMYNVEGMTCGHCAAAVVEEVTEAEGVEEADVVLDAGLLKVRGTDFADESIEAAVEKAGYRVTGSA